MPNKESRTNDEKKENNSSKIVEKFKKAINDSNKSKNHNKTGFKSKKKNKKNNQNDNNFENKNIENKVKNSKRNKNNFHKKNRKNKNKIATTKNYQNKEIEKNSESDKSKDIVEYYDLPYRYNETVVKILAQTPKRLFVYWEVSEKDRETYKNAFGEDFFEKTYPVLLVYNEEMGYTFEVPINDFANSWYLDIKDSKTKYVVKLGRRFKNINDVKISEEVVKTEHINLQNDFIYITDSNKLETPNDHVLFEKLPNQITYRNIKNGNETSKSTAKILDKFEQNYREADIRYVYYTLYGEEMLEEMLLNPSSSGLSSSSSNFRANRNLMK